ISQMFGELIGLWAAAVWQSMGAPEKINLVELGPGRGTLLVDALRAAKVVPAFEQAISLHLVETSPVLRELQRLKLGQTETIRWYDSVEDLPSEPAIVVANELFDSISITQAIEQAVRWYELAVMIDGSGELVVARARHRCQNSSRPCPRASAARHWARSSNGAPTGLRMSWRAASGWAGRR